MHSLPPMKPMATGGAWECRPEIGAVERTAQGFDRRGRGARGEGIEGEGVGGEELLVGSDRG